MNEVHPKALTQMRTLISTGSRWAAYQNQALDSVNAGQLQFLLVGLGRTYSAPPEQYPAETVAGMGWRYRFVGYVNLETGLVEKAK